MALRQVYHTGRYRCTSYYTPLEREQSCTQRTYPFAILDLAVERDAKEFVLSVDRDKLLSNYKTQAEEQLAVVVNWTIVKQKDSKKREKGKKS